MSNSSEFNESSARYRPSRSLPKQARGRERVRLILASAADLMGEQGVASVTTNAIAEHANVPIGSVYAYFDDKDAIMVALARLHTQDMINLINQLRDNPLLLSFSWYEVYLLLTASLLQYVEQHKVQEFSGYLRAEPRLSEVFLIEVGRLQAAYCELIHKRRGSAEAHPERCRLTGVYLVATTEALAQYESGPQKTRLLEMAAELMAHGFDDGVAQ